MVGYSKSGGGEKAPPPFLLFLEHCIKEKDCKNAWKNKVSIEQNK
jgi:hypothetical protein